MKPLIFIFPGQASQYVGMGRDLYENSPAARAVMDAAVALPGLNHLSEVTFDGPEELLTRTDNVQPSITTVSLMTLAAIKERAMSVGVSINPIACAGHSLGEYSAHAAAGNISEKQAIQLTAARGGWMNEASQPPNLKGGMVAVMGTSIEVLQSIVNDIGSELISVANINSPGQIILSGEAEALAKAAEAASTAGAKRVIPLNVSGAWHSPLMKSAQAKMVELLQAAISVEKINFSKSIPVVANATSDVVESIEDLRLTLGNQITSPVVWTDCVQRLLNIAGLSGRPSGEGSVTSELPLFVEVGPGKVLRGLLRSIDKGIESTGVEDMATLEAFFGMLQ